MLAMDRIQTAEGGHRKGTLTLSKWPGSSPLKTPFEPKIQRQRVVSESQRTDFRYGTPLLKGPEVRGRGLHEARGRIWYTENERGSVAWYKPWHLLDSGDPIGHISKKLLRKVSQDNERLRDFPGGPVAKTPHSQCRVLGSSPGWGTRSHMSQIRVCIGNKVRRYIVLQLRAGTAEKKKNKK